MVIRRRPSAVPESSATRARICAGNWVIKKLTNRGEFCILAAMTKNKSKALVGIIMGSQSDWSTLQHAENTLREFGVSAEVKIVSAHRTPKRLFDYATRAAGRGLKVIIAG